MKNLLWIPIAIVLLPAALSPQALPNNPAPTNVQAAAPPDAPTPVTPNLWLDRFQQLSDGQWIVVRTISGNQVRCRFAGATDASLFCDPPGPLENQPGYRFDRANIVSVNETRPQSNLHPGLLVTMAIAGTVVGLAASRNLDDQGAAAAGLLAAGIVGMIGYPIVQMQGQNQGFGFGFPLMEFGRGTPRPFGLRPHRPTSIRSMRLLTERR